MGSRIFVSTIIAAAAALFYSTFFFRKSLIGASSSPEGMPRVILGLIILVGLAILIRDWKKDGSCHFADLFKGTRLVVVVSLPIYLAALHWLGFAVSTFLLLSLLFCLFAEQRPTGRDIAFNTGLAAALSAAVFCIFRHGFHIQLPMLGSWF